MIRVLALPARLVLPALAALLTACGGAPPPAPIDQDPLLPSERPTLQMYLVLTDDPQAMQRDGDVDAMWDAVHGRTERYRPIHARLQGVPGGYEVDVELDFADLPHPMLPAEALASLIADLSPADRARAEKATFAVSLRSAAAPLTAGGQIRLVGTAALFVADKHDGIVLDLLARRAWTAGQWASELSGAVLSGGQVRLIQRIEAEGRVMLLTRGNPKYGAPDLLMRGIPSDGLTAARARFLAAQAVLLEEGGAPGRVVVLDDGPLSLTACEGVTVEVGCVSIAPPR